MYLALITAPGDPVITLEEARLHLRIDPFGSPLAHPDDTLVSRLIAAATNNLDGRDGWLGRALSTQTWELVMPGFPCGWGSFTLPLPPLQEVESIKYIDGNGVQQTVDDDDYMVINDREPAMVFPAYNTTWPSTRCQPDAVRVRFTAGYGSEDSPPLTAGLPDAIKQAMLLMVGHWYEHREEVVDGAMMVMPQASEALLTPYRIWKAMP